MRTLILIPILVCAGAAPDDAITFDAIQPQVAIAPDGTIYVAMLAGGNVKVACSKDGASFGEPVVAIDAGGNARGGARRGPRIGVDAEGNLVVTAPVCFDEAELGEKYPRAELWLVRSADEGRTWSERVRVNDVPKKASEALHWLGVAPNGDAHVVWLDHREQGKGNCLWYAKVEDTNESRDRQLTGEVCSCCAPGMTVDGEGNPIVAVRDNSRSNKTVLLLSSKNVGKSFGKARQVNVKRSDISTCPMDAPAAAVSADGETIAVAWMDMRRGREERDVFWRIFNQGKPGPEMDLDPDPEGRQGHVALAVDDDGVAHAVWESNGRIRYRSSDRDAVDTVSVPWERAATQPSLAANGGVLVVAYEAGRGGRTVSVVRILE